MTWDEIYEAADGCACGSPELKRKDNARWNVTYLMIQMGLPDPNEDEIPEESIEDYINKMNIRFDDCGRIEDMTLPPEIEELIFRKKQKDYIREDFETYADDKAEEGEEQYPTDEEFEYMVDLFLDKQDCNVAYNDTVQNVYEQVMEERS